MWPIGSVYISVNARSAPFQNIPNCRSTWVQLSTGRTLWNVETTDQLGSLIDAGLPNIVGSISGIPDDRNGGHQYVSGSGAFSTSGGQTAVSYSLGSSDKDNTKVTFDASESNSIYGKSTTVQPAAIKTTMWKRIA